MARGYLPCEKLSRLAKIKLMSTNISHDPFCAFHGLHNQLGRSLGLIMPIQGGMVKEYWEMKEEIKKSKKKKKVEPRPEINV